MNNQTTQTNATVQRLTSCRFEQLRKAKTITRADIANAPPAALYAAVVEHWHKCTPCAQQELLASRVGQIQDCAKVMSSLFVADNLGQRNQA